MGSKASTNFQSDRPESGGADRRSEREKSGLLEREKQKFAAEEAEKARLPEMREGKESPVKPPAGRTPRRARG
jgi:hypothetical protein